jgi:hypothetical protein
LRLDDRLFDGRKQGAAWCALHAATSQGLIQIKHRRRAGS